MTKKNLSTFKCSICDFGTLQWLGKCPSCQNWNSMSEINEANSKRNCEVSSQKSTEIENENFEKMDYWTNGI